MRILNLGLLVIFQVACQNAKFTVTKAADSSSSLAAGASGMTESEYNGTNPTGGPTFESGGTISLGATAPQRFPASCAGLKAQLNSDAFCTSQKGSQFVDLLKYQATIQGISLQGSNFLGCDARNFANGQAPDTLPAQLNGVDGVIFFNVTGTHMNYQVNVPQRAGFVVLTLMCEDGGSEIIVNLNYTAPVKVGYRFLGIHSGGSHVTVSGLNFQGRALFSLKDMGGSYINVNAQNSVMNVEAINIGGSSFLVNSSPVANLVGDFNLGPINIP